MSDRIEFDHAALAALAADNFDAAGHVAVEVLADMRRGCPVDSGTLLGSLDLEPDRPGKRYKVGSTDVDYAEDVELGTSRAAAQPFMRPAVYQNRAMGR